MIHVDEHARHINAQQQEAPPPWGATTALTDEIRAALPHVRVHRVRQGLEHVVDLLAEARASGQAGSLSRADAPPSVRDAFRAALQAVTVEERDRATDEVVLAITFGINGDDAMARAHLAALGAL